MFRYSLRLIGMTLFGLLLGGVIGLFGEALTLWLLFGDALAQGVIVVLFTGPICSLLGGVTGFDIIYKSRYWNAWIGLIAIGLIYLLPIFLFLFF